MFEICVPFEAELAIVLIDKAIKSVHYVVMLRNLMTEKYHPPPRRARRS